MVILAEKSFECEKSERVAELRVGVIGYGYWGPNVARNLRSLENCELTAISDSNPASLRRARQACPGAELTTDWSALISSPQIDAIAVVTPVSTHYQLAKAALENGKHVFVEKPFTSTSHQAEELIELAMRESSQDYGGSHLLVHGCGQTDSPACR